MQYFRLFSPASTRSISHIVKEDKFCHTLEQKLSSALHKKLLLQLLDLAIADAEGLSSSVQQTSALSERVSKKVRELDTAQSRANEAADRIRRLVNRTKAVAGVQQAIAVNDYETAAKYVEEHLQLQKEMSSDGKAESPHPSEQEKASFPKYKAQTKKVIHCSQTFYKIAAKWQAHQSSDYKFAVYPTFSPEYKASINNMT